MVESMTVRVDDKGRLTIPRDVRAEFHIEPGDTLFMAADRQNHVLRITKAVNPFDVLAEHALEEYAAGRTRNLREIAKEAGIKLKDG